jgi:hypothetical protein
MQLRFLILLFIFAPTLLVSTASASWFGDDDKGKNCYNWYGEKEQCYTKHSEKKESYVGFEFKDFYGSEDESLTSSTGYGLTYLTTSSLDAFRFLFGGSLYYADGFAYLSSTRHAMTMYSGEVLLGFSIKAYRRSVVRPFLEVLAIGGFKSLEMTRPPTGVDNRTFGFSYGGKGSMGMEFGFWKATALRASIEYYDVRSKLAGSDSLPITSLGVGVGIVVFH